MLSSNPSRRNVLKTSAALASVGAIGSIAGCQGGDDPSDGGDGSGTDGSGGDGSGGDGSGGDGSGGDGSGSDGSGGDGNMPSGSGDALERAGMVPSRADLVLHADYQQFVNDEDLKQLLEMGVQSGSGAGSVEEALQAQGVTGIDPGQLYDAVMFAEIPEDNPTEMTAASYGGAIVWSAISSSQLKTTLREESQEQFTESTYNGTTILTSESGENAFGFVTDGVLVAGTEAAVKDVIDVNGGSGDALSGPVTDGLGNTNAAPIRFAADLPQSGSMDGGDGSSTGGTGAVQYTNEMDVVSGSLFYKSESEVGFRVNMTMTDEQQASELKTLMDQFKTQYEQQADEMEQGGEQLKQMLDNLSISQSGTTLSVSYQDTVEGLMQLAQSGGLPMGGGMGGTGSLAGGDGSRVQPAAMVLPN
jgi:hypothetical protein